MGKGGRPLEGARGAIIPRDGARATTHPPSRDTQGCRSAVVAGRHASTGRDMHAPTPVQDGRRRQDNATLTRSQIGTRACARVDTTPCCVSLRHIKMPINASRAECGPESPSLPRQEASQQKNRCCRLALSHPAASPNKSSPQIRCCQRHLALADRSRGPDGGPRGGHRGLASLSDGEPRVGLAPNHLRAE